jgi:hypothetical protein
MKARVKQYPLRLKPIGRDQANNFIVKYHRHHGRITGCKFTIAAVRGRIIVGVAVGELPKSRGQADGYTLEVSRFCTLGGRNTCSFLYAACRRVARELGYHRIITYILAEESGISLKASGWIKSDHIISRGDWSSKSRPRNYKGPTGPKTMWYSILVKDPIYEYSSGVPRKK